jgi:hypothetical protein
MCNQYSSLFICIIDYLYVLCMIFMVLSCILCMTLIVFIYVYYGLFACINLIEVMSLFFTFFVPFTNFRRKSAGFWQNLSKNRHGKTGRFIGETGHNSMFSVFSVHLSSPVSFGRIFSIFSKTDEIGEAQFF